MKLKHLFIIDDDPDDIEFFTMSLRSINCEVIYSFANDGEQAITMLTDQFVTPDLIILDLNLPGLSGKEILEKLKADPTLKNIPVVIYSTSSLVNHKEECFSLGAIDYISKPFSLEGIDEAVKKILTYLNL